MKAYHHFMKPVHKKSFLLVTMGSLIESITQKNMVPPKHNSLFYINGANGLTLFNKRESDLF